MWRIEVKDKPGIFDALGESVHRNILDLGFNSVKNDHFASYYFKVIKQ